MWLVAVATLVLLIHVCCSHFLVLLSVHASCVYLLLPSLPPFLPPPSFQQVQLTDFENAAFVVFIVLLTRTILSFGLNFLIPISKVGAGTDTGTVRFIYVTVALSSQSRHSSVCHGAPPLPTVPVYHHECYLRICTACDTL